MNGPQPVVGEWYRYKGGDLFEVVACDEEDGTIEIQYFDGTVEELDMEDWESQWAEGSLEDAEAPEDWTGSVDIDSEDDARGTSVDSENDRVWASPLDSLDIFESR